VPLAAVRLRRPPTADAALALALMALATVETLVSTDIDPGPRTLAAAVLMPLALAWRRAAALAVAVAVVIVWSLSGAENSLYAFLCGLVAVYSCGGDPDPPRAVAGAALFAVSLVAMLTVDPDRGGVTDFIFTGVLFGGSWGLGRLVHQRTSRAGALERRAEAAERERAPAVADERRRIARELHDVIAHTISVMVVQTGVVRRRLRNERPQDSELLSGVEATGREAIADLRRLLDILRADDEALALAPQPGLGELDRLTAQVRAAGLPVDLAVEGEALPLPGGVELVAYRVVQESLTNALKHAHATRASVRLRYGGAALDVVVTDDGGGVQANGSGTGHGLIGLRQRVALYGGSFVARPLPAGGFEVHASLPIEPGR